MDNVCPFRWPPACNALDLNLVFRKHTNLNHVSNLHLFTPSMVSDTVPRNHGARRDHSALQLPCGRTNCLHYFKTQAGRTKHWHIAHPTTVTRSAPSATHEDSEDLVQQDHPTSEEPTGLPGFRYYDDGPTGPNDSEMEQDRMEGSSAPPSPGDIDAEFWGLGDHIYRNYHKHLDGNIFTLSDF